MAHVEEQAYGRGNREADAKQKVPTSFETSLEGRYRAYGALGAWWTHRAFRAFRAQLDVDDCPLADVLLDLSDLQPKDTQQGTQQTVSRRHKE